MATQVLPAFLPESTTSENAAATPPRRLSLAHRLFDAFTQAQMRRAHREIARVMNDKGLRFTEGYQPRK
jgi:hypothetical protein